MNTLLNMTQLRIPDAAPDYAPCIYRLLQHLESGQEIMTENAYLVGSSPSSLARRIKDLKDGFGVPIESRGTPVISSMSGRKAFVKHYFLNRQWCNLNQQRLRELYHLLLRSNVGPATRKHEHPVPNSAA